MKRLPLAAAALMAVSLLLPIGHEGEAIAYWPGAPAALLCALVAIAAAAALLRWHGHSLMPALAVAGLLIGAIPPLLMLWSGRSLGVAAPGLWLFVIGLGVLAWQAMEMLARAARAGLPGIAAPLLFGAWIVYLWEVVVVGFGVPQILLPAPHQIFSQIVNQSPVLWSDFRQTFLKAVLAGWAAGCALGFAVAVNVDPDVLVLDFRLEDAPRQLEAGLLLPPDIGIGGQHTARAAALGLERIEAVPRADVEDGLSLEARRDADEISAHAPLRRRVSGRNDAVAEIEAVIPRPDPGNFLTNLVGVHAPVFASSSQNGHRGRCVRQQVDYNIPSMHGFVPVVAVVLRFARSRSS